MEINQAGYTVTLRNFVRDEYLAGKKYLSFESFTAPIQVTVLSCAYGSLRGASIEFHFGHFSLGKNKKAGPFSQRLPDGIEDTNSPLLPAGVAFTDSVNPLKHSAVVCSEIGRVSDIIMFLDYYK